MLINTIEDRGRHRHTVTQVLRQTQHLLVTQTADVFLFAAGVVDLIEELAHCVDLGLGLDHHVDLLTQPLGCPTQMSLQHLTDVHT